MTFYDPKFSLFCLPQTPARAAQRAALASVSLPTAQQNLTRHQRRTYSRTPLHCRCGSTLASSGSTRFATAPPHSNQSLPHRHKFLLSAHCTRGEPCGTPLTFGSGVRARLALRRRTTRAAFTQPPDVWYNIKNNKKGEAKCSKEDRMK